MIVRRIAQTVSAVCLVILMAANSRAGYITYRTSEANSDSDDASGDLPTINLLGTIPTLLYSPDVYDTNSDYGFFTLSCPGCANNANDNADGAAFGAFGRHMESYGDVNGNAGDAFRHFSAITVSWAAQRSRPETKPTRPAVASGSRTSPDPTSPTTVQSSIVTSRPAAFALFGGGLIALSLLGWKKIRR